MTVENTSTRMYEEAEVSQSTGTQEEHRIIDEHRFVYVCQCHILRYAEEILAWIITAVNNDNPLFSL